MLNIINRFFVKMQRYVQGIPAGSANLYEKIAARFLSPIYRNITEEVCKNINEKSNMLEIGCGTGKLLIEILKKMKVKNIIGLDISSAMIKISRKNLVKNNMYELADLVLADAHKIPLRNMCINLIISTGTLHHIRKPEKMFVECNRILKNGGEAWIYEFSHDAPKSDLVKFANILKKPKYILRILSVMHGLPRQTYEKGYIKNSLAEAEVKYRIEYIGVLTKLVLMR